jgi:hypothetical protein
VKDTQDGVATINLWVDHKKAENPYLTRYDKSHWVDEMHTTTALKKVLCVTTVTKHIVDQSANVSKGTECEDKWYFYHGALSQTTCKKTKDNELHLGR